MKKIPTLFKKEYENHKIKCTLNEVTEGMEWVLKGEGIATVKYDGSCCAVIGGVLYKRYDVKKGRTIPEGAIKCQEEDKITGHLPCWVKCVRGNSADKWFWNAYDNTLLATGKRLADGTYEAVGTHFQGNPYKYDRNILLKHGDSIIDVPRTYEGLKEYLCENEIEGIVFWKDGEPQCKIKRTDFGFNWNSK